MSVDEITKLGGLSIGISRSISFCTPVLVLLTYLH